MAIPLNTAETDSWFWSGDRFGNYTVKIAYLILKEAKELDGSNDNCEVWKKMWNMKKPLKVKIFMWRALKECLPTKDNLNSRRINVSPYCLVCSMKKETIRHFLVGCSVAEKTWCLAGCRTRGSKD